MDNLIEKKPAKKFAIGGILVLAYTLICFFARADRDLQFLFNLSLISKGTDALLFEFNTFIYTGIELLLFITELILLAVFGALLLAKVHSRLLAVIPALNVLLCGASFLNECAYDVCNQFFLRWFGVDSTVAEFIHHISYGLDNLFHILSELISYLIAFALWNCIEVVPHIICWGLLLLVILLNCSKKRTADDKGRLSAFAWILPPLWFVAGCSATVGALLTVVVERLIYGYTVLHYSYFRDTLVRWLERIIYSAQPIMNHPAQFLFLILDIIAAAALALFCAVTMFFVIRWIVSPYKKKLPDIE